MKCKNLREVRLNEGCPVEIGRHLPQTVQVVTVQPDAPALEERCRQMEERGQQNAWQQQERSQASEQTETAAGRQAGKIEAVQEQREKIIAELRAPLQECQMQLEQIGCCRGSWWNKCSRRRNNTRHFCSTASIWKKSSSS